MARDPNEMVTMTMPYHLACELMSIGPTRRIRDEDIVIDDENPEWTPEMFAQARPFEEVHAEQLGAEGARSSK